MSLALAIDHAKLNPIIALPRMAAIITDGRRIVSRGWNSKKTHPLAAKYGKHAACVCIHAELAAIVNAREPVDGMSMFIARVYRNDQPALAAPCVGCRKALIAFNLGSVEWTI